MMSIKGLEVHTTRIDTSDGWTDGGNEVEAATNPIKQKVVDDRALRKCGCPVHDEP